MKVPSLKYIFICAFALTITGVLVGSAVHYPSNTMSTTQDTQVTATHLPQVSSLIKSLHIVNDFVDDDGTLNVVVQNNAEKGIQALTVSSGSYGVTLDDGLVSDHPKTIIKPKATYTIYISIANLKTTIPVVISGIIYDDDTEDGKPDVVSTIRKEREREKSKRLSKVNEKIED